MLCVLRREMNPFMQDYARHCFGHHGIPPIGAHPQGERTQHFDNSTAIDIYEWLNTTVNAWHPTKRAHDHKAWARNKPAIAVNIDDDPSCDPQAGLNLVASEQIDVAGKRWSGWREIGLTSMHRIK